MKIAISTEGDFVSPHFGRCPHFTIAEIQDNSVIMKEVISNPGHHPGYLPGFFRDKGVDWIIAGGMGQRARMLFDEGRIKTVMGVSGRIDDILDRICRGTLEGGESLCMPGAGKGYGVDKTECDNDDHDHEHDRDTL
jgi:predicted Fe-Mo cluster-binding NifX family protein